MEGIDEKNMDEKIKEEYLSGKSLIETGKIVGLTAVGVRNHLKKMGIPRRPRGQRKLPEETILKMFTAATIEMKREPSLQEFAKILGVDVLTLRRYRNIYPCVKNLPFNKHARKKRSPSHRSLVGELKIPAINEDSQVAGSGSEVVSNFEDHGSSEAEAEIKKVEAEAEVNIASGQTEVTTSG